MILNIVGDESLSETLRATTAAELYLHARKYANHQRFHEILQHPDASLSVKSYISISLTDDGIKCLDFGNDITAAIERVASATCLKKSWSSMIHMFALSSVLDRVIWSVYPETNKAIRPLYHGEIKPLEHQDNASISPIYLMWSRDGNLDNRFGSLFEPNHFVPLIKKNIREDEFDSDDDLILSVDDSVFVTNATQCLKPDELSEAHKASLELQVKDAEPTQSCKPANKTSKEEKGPPSIKLQPEAIDKSSGCYPTNEPIKAHEHHLLSDTENNISNVRSQEQGGLETKQDNNLACLATADEPTFPYENPPVLMMTNKPKATIDTDEGFSKLMNLG